MSFRKTPDPDGKHKVNTCTGCGASERSLWDKILDAWARAHRCVTPAQLQSSTARRGVTL